MSRRKFSSDCLTKRDLIDLVAKGVKDKVKVFDRRYARRPFRRVSEEIIKIIVDRTFYEINHACLEKKSVVISNFGKFYLIKIKARAYFSPFIKKIIQKPAKWRVKFRSANRVRKLMEGVY